MKLTIENHNASLGTYISRLFTCYQTDDKELTKAVEWVNLTINAYKHKPATPENCRLLQAYIIDKYIVIYKRPWSFARNQLLMQCKDKIDTLQTGCQEPNTDIFEAVETLIQEAFWKKSKARYYEINQHGHETL